MVRSRIKETSITFHTTKRGQFRLEKYQWGMEGRWGWVIQGELPHATSIVHIRSLCRILLWFPSGSNRSKLESNRARLYEYDYVANSKSRGIVSVVGSRSDGYIVKLCDNHWYLQHKSATISSRYLRIVESAKAINELVSNVSTPKNK